MTVIGYKCPACGSCLMEYAQDYSGVYCGNCGAFRTTNTGIPENLVLDEDDSEEEDDWIVTTEEEYIDYIYELWGECAAPYMLEGEIDGR